MAKQKTTEVNKSEEIRLALKANPKGKAKDIQAALGEKGIEVKTSQIYFVMGRLKGGKKKAKKVAATEIAAVTPSTNGDAVKTILKVKGWASEVGGMKKLKSLVDALSE